jgi:gluconolactonase
MLSPNGIALSADGSILYVTETETARLWAFDIVEAGCFLRGRDTPHGGRLVAGLPGFQKFDGMALDEEGNICIATPVSGAISVIRPDGALVRQFFLNDPQITNICFGGLEFRTAYITCGGTGELLCAPWPTRGLPLVFDS